MPIGHSLYLTGGSIILILLNQRRLIVDTNIEYIESVIIKAQARWVAEGRRLERQSIIELLQGKIDEDNRSSANNRNCWIRLLFGALIEELQGMK